jgi:ABC-type sugar transport system substrate-binding protein
MSSDNRHMPRRRLQSAAILAVGLVSVMSIPALGQQDPSAPSKLSEFEPFVPSDTVGAIPDLPRRAAFMVPNTIAYYTDIGKGIEAGAATKGVEFALVSSEADPVKNIDQINQEIQRGIGCLIVQPQDAAAQAPVLQAAIDQGIYVNFFVTPPANTQTMADQYDLGYQQAKTAVAWINENLGGEAVVANFTLDFIEALIPRREGTEAGLAEGGAGIEVIDVPVLQDSPDEGFRLASTLLQSRPDINVWIGPDSTVLSVNAYLESIGKDPAVDKIYLSGLNGEQEALDAVSAGDTFMKSTWGFNNSLLGYAMGAACGDWLDGKTVPQVLQVGGTEATSAEEVQALQAMIDDPAGQYELLLAGTQDGNKLWGSTSFENKDNYIRNIITGG